MAKRAKQTNKAESKKPSTKRKLEVATGDDAERASKKARKDGRKAEEKKAEEKKSAKQGQEKKTR